MHPVHVQPVLGVSHDRNTEPPMFDGSHGPRSTGGQTNPAEPDGGRAVTRLAVNRLSGFDFEQGIQFGNGHGRAAE